MFKYKQNTLPVTHDLLILYRYASLYFCCGLEDQDNELLALEVLHRYVELLDKYFGNVSKSELLSRSSPPHKTIRSY